MWYKKKTTSYIISKKCAFVNTINFSFTIKYENCKNPLQKGKKEGVKPCFECEKYDISLKKCDISLKTIFMDIL